jgi:hypothetical protein
MTHDGYGDMNVKGKHLRVGRIAYYLEYGTIDSKSLIRHSCDNTSCVNPRHLLQGNKLQNAQDMISRGRQSSGEWCPSKPKLSLEIAAEIINRHEGGESKHALARCFDVDVKQIIRIVRGESWKDARMLAYVSRLAQSLDLPVFP